MQFPSQNLLCHGLTRIFTDKSDVVFYLCFICVHPWLISAFVGGSSFRLLLKTYSPTDESVTAKNVKLVSNKKH